MPPRLFADGSPPGHPRTRPACSRRSPGWSSLSRPPVETT